MSHFREEQTQATYGSTLDILKYFQIFKTSNFAGFSVYAGPLSAWDLSLCPHPSSPNTRRKFPDLAVRDLAFSKATAVSVLSSET